MSLYELGLCQKFNQTIHGFNEDTSSPQVKEHYICHYTFRYSNKLDDYIAFAKCYGATIEIVETIYLNPGNEMAAIYKTFWLRIFQRICRKWVIQHRFARSSQLHSFILKREYQMSNIPI